MRLIGEGEAERPRLGKRVFRYVCANGEGLEEVLAAFPIKRHTPFQDRGEVDARFLAMNLSAKMVDKIGTCEDEVEVEVEVEYLPAVFLEVKRLKEEIATLRLLIQQWRSSRHDTFCTCKLCANSEWPLRENKEDGCVPGNCSMRPRPKTIQEEGTMAQNIGEMNVWLNLDVATAALLEIRHHVRLAFHADTPSAYVIALHGITKAAKDALANAETKAAAEMISQEGIPAWADEERTVLFGNPSVPKPTGVLTVDLAKGTVVQKSKSAIADLKSDKKCPQ